MHFIFQFDIKNEASIILAADSNGTPFLVDGTQRIDIVSFVVWSQGD